MVGKGNANVPDHDLRNVGTVAIAPAERRLRLARYGHDTDETLSTPWVLGAEQRRLLSPWR